MILLINNNNSTKHLRRWLKTCTFAEYHELLTLFIIPFLQKIGWDNGFTKKDRAMKRLMIAAVVVTMLQGVEAQGLKRVYDEKRNGLEQIDSALAVAKAEAKHVICQVGGNWCAWCLRFAAFIEADQDISNTVADNYVYIHVNYRRGTDNGDMLKAMAKLGNPVRFGFPVMVVLDADGKVLHTQDSSFLESGDSYDRKKVMRFLQCWRPAAVK